MLLHDGVVEAEGDPDEVARRYLRLNFEGAPQAGHENDDWGGSADIRLLDAWLEGADGERVTSVETGAELRLGAVFEATREVNQPSFGFVFANADGIEVTGVGRDLPEGVPDRLEPGQKVRISATVENPLAPGRYVVKCWVFRNHTYGDLVLHAPHALDFVVYGTQPAGLIAVHSEVTVTVEEPS
jgi:hypothetical protein